ncbi:MAG: Aldehyde reductase Ahr [Chlamydiae bacterium]|nr:Aldehyde reductase Ahr [Chlamydiota bacterium]
MPIATKTIEGFAAQKEKSSLQPYKYEAHPLGNFDIEVEITHCGICHSDLHMINNDWKISKYPLLPGHEIIGNITQKGEKVTELNIGQRVGIGWQSNSCRKCEWCHQGEENLCLTQESTCVGRPGGFAKSLIVDHHFAFSIPENLKSENAAPLLCGGATVFSPLLQHGVDGTFRIGVFGIGGLGHLALQFAKAFGCEVFAFSSSMAKEKEAKELGATHYISTSDPSHLAKLKNSIDLILYTSSHIADFSQLMGLLRPKGKLCLLGVPENGKVNLPIVDFIDGRKTVCGSNIASPPVIQKMLEFAARHGIVAKTELFPMSEVNTALDKLKANQIHYRAVLCN